MSSTFTAFLKFNKPALGDAGWGTAVNGGFTDLVDQAITGFIEKAPEHVVKVGRPTFNTIKYEAVINHSRVFAS